MQKLIAFEAFKDTVIFYKAISIYHLLNIYFQGFDIYNIDYVSIMMIIAGYALSSYTCLKIGVDQTYFGAELGRILPNRISGFPYNCIPRIRLLTHRSNDVRKYFCLIGIHETRIF
jgi:hypothetical protein